MKNDILDDFNEEPKVEEKNLITYLVIMGVGSIGIAFTVTGFRFGFQTLIETGALLFYPLLTGTFVEGVSRFWKKIKKKEMPETSFLFDLVENGFAWWVFFVILGYGGIIYRVLFS